MLPHTQSAGTLLDIFVYDFTAGTLLHILWRGHRYIINLAHALRALSAHQAYVWLQSYSPQTDQRRSSCATAAVFRAPATQRCGCSSSIGAVASAIGALAVGRRLGVHPRGLAEGTEAPAAGVLARATPWFRKALLGYRKPSARTNRRAWLRGPHQSQVHGSRVPRLAANRVARSSNRAAHRMCHEAVASFAFPTVARSLCI